MIGADRVSFRYPKGDIIFTDLSFSLNTGESTTIIGPSGCGKTTLLYLLYGIYSPDSGIISYNGVPLLNIQRHAAMILQDYGLFPWKSVEENIGLGLYLRGASKADICTAVASMLEQMGLRGLGRRYPSQLSGGQQQRVAIARALALDPSYLLMDEPFSALDAMTREELQNLLLSSVTANRVTVILVTHSIDEAVFLGRKILVLNFSGRANIVDNPAMGRRDYRYSQAFFDKCVEVRRIICA